MSHKNKGSASTGLTSQKKPRTEARSSNTFTSQKEQHRGSSHRIAGSISSDDEDDDFQGSSRKQAELDDSVFLDEPEEMDPRSRRSRYELVMQQRRDGTYREPPGVALARVCRKACIDELNSLKHIYIRNAMPGPANGPVEKHSTHRTELEAFQRSVVGDRIATGNADAIKELICDRVPPVPLFMKSLKDRKPILLSAKVDLRAKELDNPRAMIQHESGLRVWVCFYKVNNRIVYVVRWIQIHSDAGGGWGTNNDGESQCLDLLAQSIEHMGEQHIVRVVDRPGVKVGVFASLGSWAERAAVYDAMLGFEIPFLELDKPHLHPPQVVEKFMVSDCMNPFADPAVEAKAVAHSRGLLYNHLVENPRDMTFTIFTLSTANSNTLRQRVGTFIDGVDEKERTIPITSTTILHGNNIHTYYTEVGGMMSPDGVFSMPYRLLAVVSALSDEHRARLKLLDYCEGQSFNANMLNLALSEVSPGVHGPVVDMHDRYITLFPNGQAWGQTKCNNDAFCEVLLRLPLKLGVGAEHPLAAVVSVCMKTNNINLHAYHTYEVTFGGRIHTVSERNSENARMKDGQLETMAQVQHSLEFNNIASAPGGSAQKAVPGDIVWVEHLKVYGQLEEVSAPSQVLTQGVKKLAAENKIFFPCRLFSPKTHKLTHVVIYRKPVELKFCKVEAPACKASFFRDCACETPVGCEHLLLAKNSP